MKLDKKLVDALIKVTSLAAYAASVYIGKKDKIAADKAAVDTMRNELNKIDIDGEIVIGEGELDKAPMLYIGEKVGTKSGPKFDIAVDPCEGTNFVANNLPGGMSVISLAEKNNLFKAPETYMSKIAAANIPNNLIDLDFTIEKNIKNLADHKNKELSKINVCILNRPRHKEIINKMQKLGVGIKLISDGDISGALLITDPKHKIDLFVGIGGGPEGVLAASALDAYNSFFQGRFLFETDESISRAKKMGITDLNRKYNLDEIVKGDSIFCATGITSGDLCNGIKIEHSNFYSETFVTHKKTDFKNIVRNKFKIN